MKILYAVPEAAPFITESETAEFPGEMAKALSKEGADCRVILPLYSCMPQKWKDTLTYRTHFYMDFGYNSYYVGVMECELDGVHYYFIENQDFFTGRTPCAGMPYDIGRFAFFSKAVLKILPSIEFRPDIIHCIGWQASLIPVYLDTFFKKDDFFGGIKTVLTSFDIGKQGVWDCKKMMDITSLPSSCFTRNKMEHNRDGNMLKGGIVYADAVTTVSETYAEEVRMPYYGEGLDSVLRSRGSAFTGILNGISRKEWDPEKDQALVACYTAENAVQKKAENKAALQKELALEEDPDIMMMAVICPLNDRNGLDLFAYTMDEVCRDRVQFVFLGTGEERYQNMFRHYEYKYGTRIFAGICKDPELTHRILAASDAFLMPAQINPGGKGALAALRYGCIPIVRETGGLKDAVTPYAQYENTGTGFTFSNYNAHELLGTIRSAEAVYYDAREEWDKMLVRAMEQDFSWEKTAGKYMKLYKKTAGQDTGK